MTPEAKELAEAITCGRVDEIDSDYLASLFEAAVKAIIKECDLEKIAPQYIWNLLAKHIRMDKR